MAAEGRYEHEMTLAELCQSLDEGRLPYTIRDGHYEVRAEDMRRLQRVDRARFALPHPTEIPAELLGSLDQSQLNYTV